MKMASHILIIADYVSEELSVYTLENINDVHRHLVEQEADEIIKDKIYKDRTKLVKLIEIKLTLGV